MTNVGLCAIVKVSNSYCSLGEIHIFIYILITLCVNIISFIQFTARNIDDKSERFKV